MNSKSIFKSKVIQGALTTLVAAIVTLCQPDLTLVVKIASWTGVAMSVYAILGRLLSQPTWLYFKKPKGI